MKTWFKRFYKELQDPFSQQVLADPELEACCAACHGGVGVLGIENGLFVALMYGGFPGGEKPGPHLDAFGAQGKGRGKASPPPRGKGKGARRCGDIGDAWVDLLQNEKLYAGGFCLPAAGQGRCGLRL